MSQELCLRNRQRIRLIDLRLFRRIALTLMQEQFSKTSCCLCIHLVDSSEITRLNETFLRHAGPTDVITFNYAGDAYGGGLTKGRTSLAIKPDAAAGQTSPLHGEIFISVPEAMAQARRFRTTWPAELVRYAVHGLLHLLGYDDQTAGARRRMKGEEDRLVRRLSRQFSMTELARTPEGARRRRARLAGLRD
jgi:probable rRNA maturation factor